MKKTLFIFLILSCLTLKAQQEEYTAFLEQAWTAIEKGDEKGLNSNLKYFSVAINRDKITPEILTEKNLRLYTNCLYYALTNEFKLSDDLANQAVLFLQYNIEKYPDNYFSLGYLYEKGYGVKQDYDKALYWYEKAINLGNSAAAMNNVGFIYYGRKNYTQAKYWFEKATAKGNVAGTFSLAYLYEYGLGVEQNITKSLELYEISANGGYVNAMFNLGIIYLEGTKIKADAAKSKFWFKKAADYGDAEAMVYLGDTFLIGDTVMQSHDEAIYWYNKSCNLGFQKGCEKLNSLK